MKVRVTYWCAFDERSKELIEGVQVLHIVLCLVGIIGDVTILEYFINQELEELNTCISKRAEENFMSEAR